MKSLFVIAAVAVATMFGLTFTSSVQASDIDTVSIAQAEPQQVYRASDLKTRAIETGVTVTQVVIDQNGNVSRRQVPQTRVMAGGGGGGIGIGFRPILRRPASIENRIAVLKPRTGMQRAEARPAVSALPVRSATVEIVLE